MSKSLRTLVLVFAAGLALPLLIKSEPAEDNSPPPAASEVIDLPTADVPQTVSVLTPDGIADMDMQEYLVGVVSAEMPALFELEALKAQAVAARTYAMYCAGKHGDAQVCTDYACCQAWQSDSELRDKWGDDYDAYIEKIRSAVAATDGVYLGRGGEPILAAFHASSSGATENCTDVWGGAEYLVSVTSPETADDVPNFVSTVICTKLDFRDIILSAHPEADMTGEAETWIEGLTRDAAGRVCECRIGGVQIPGTAVRTLFSLRSTDFELVYDGESFVFTVSGSGHGIGMSQYGANVMAQNGSTWQEILAHYYPNAELIGAQ